MRLYYLGRKNRIILAKVWLLIEKMILIMKKILNMIDIIFIKYRYKLYHHVNIQNCLWWWIKAAFLGDLYWKKNTNRSTLKINNIGRSQQIFKNYMRSGIANKFFTIWDIAQLCSFIILEVRCGNAKVIHFILNSVWVWFGRNWLNCE